MGDPSGIGPDILLQSWAKRTMLNLPDFFVVGDIDFLAKRAQLLGLEIEFTKYKNATSTSHLSVLPLPHSVVGTPGQISPEDAKATIDSINTCVELALKNKVSGIVTCPINKKTLYDAGFTHPGHTEYLAELASDYGNTTVTPVMMLAGPELKTVPVTIHIPLKDVPTSLTSEMIVETCKIAAADLTAQFGIENPRLAISGLNPHAGENGSMGQEDETIIAPAVKELEAQGIKVRGPLPADTMFHKRARETYDAAICMYHDQALIPAKTLGFDDAVNVTLGLPFIRTSPDHGTAFEIAGTGEANPSSFVAALKMAAEIAQRS